MKKIPAIVASYWKSDVLQYKSLIRLANGKTVLEMIADSLRKMDVVDRIILATSDSIEDDLLADEAERLDVEVYRGESDRILGRLAGLCASLSGPVLKVDGNKPLFDPVAAQRLIHAHIGNNCEYSYNGHYSGVVYGTGCEVFGAEIFTKIDTDKLSAGSQCSQSLTVHVRANPQTFRIYAEKYGNPRPDYKVLLETRVDLEVINDILKNVNEVTNETIIPFLDEHPIVAGHNKLEKANEVGFNKIMLFPEKIRAIHSIDFDRPDPVYPVSVELSITNRCNLNCIWCSDKNLRARQKDDMSIETIRALARGLSEHETKGVTIEGGGEPTIVGYFDEVVDIFKTAGLGLGLITNGLVRLSEEVVNKFDWIRVSLDVSCPKEMRRLKGSDRFEDVMQNIIFYAAQKPVVGVGYVTTNQNISQVESLVIRLKESGVDYIQFRPVVDHPELLSDYDFDYLKKYQTNPFSVITDGMKENMIAGNNGISCRCHSLSAVITADGSVFLCGRLNRYRWFPPIGNINEQTFHEIWNGDERKRQANMVLDEEFCSANCPECRITKFNIEFDHLTRIKTTEFI